MKQNLLILIAGLVAFGTVFVVTRYRNSSPEEPAQRPTSHVTTDVTRPVASPDGMVLLAGGEYTMGTDSELGWPDEKPAHKVRVDRFWIDVTEVTNSQFAQFVAATQYVTTAEKVPSVEELLAQSPPGTPVPPKESLVAGSLVFTMTDGPVDLKTYSLWWKWTPGANWRHPEGPDSNLDDR